MKIYLTLLGASLVLSSLVGCSMDQVLSSTSEEDGTTSEKSVTESTPSIEQEVDAKLGLACIDVWAATRSAGGPAWVESWGRVAMSFRDLAALDASYSSLYEDAIQVQADSSGFEAVKALGRLIDACPVEE